MEAWNPRNAEVALAGDWHGNGAFARRVIEQVADRTDTLLHLGDFGIWPGPEGSRYLREMERVCAENGVRILITLGNHEDWNRVLGRWENPKLHHPDGSLLPIHLSEHIQVLPRGYRFQLVGDTERPVSVVSLGGAPSVDFERRREGRTWWPEEMITEDDVDRVVAGGYADLMLTHDAPGPPYATHSVERVISSNPLGWSATAVAYAAMGRGRITRAFEGVRPRLLAHGHYHVADETTLRFEGADYDTTVWSLHCDQNEGNWRILQLDSVHFQHARPSG